LRTHQGTQGGTTTASGVPHTADGLVHPTVVAGHGRSHSSWLRRRRCGQRVHRHRLPAHPRPVSRQPLHRRRPGTRGRLTTTSVGDATLPACPTTRRACGRATVGRRRHGHREYVRVVPTAGDREIRGTLRHPESARRGLRKTTATALFTRLPRRRGRQWGASRGHTLRPRPTTLGGAGRGLRIRGTFPGFGRSDPLQPTRVERLRTGNRHVRSAVVTGLAHATASLLLRYPSAELFAASHDMRRALPLIR